MLPATLYRVDIERKSDKGQIHNISNMAKLKSKGLEEFCKYYHMKISKIKKGFFRKIVCKLSEKKVPCYEYLYFLRVIVDKMKYSMFNLCL